MIEPHEKSKLSVEVDFYTNGLYHDMTVVHSALVSFFLQSSHFLVRAILGSEPRYIEPSNYYQSGSTPCLQPCADLMRLENSDSSVSLIWIP